MLDINDYEIDLLNLIDIEKTSNELLSQIRTLIPSDAGTIYIKDGNNLRISAFQNSSLSSFQIEEIRKDNMSLLLPLNNRQYIAVESFLSVSEICINDIYEEKKLDIDGIKNFDTRFNYKTYSMITIPLIDVESKNPIGILQIINKIEDGKFISYSNQDVELVKMASSFITYSLSAMIEYKKSLEKTNEIINSIINYEIYNRIEKDRLNCFENKIIYTSRVLKDIAHQWRQPLCELSINNAYLSSKSKNKEINELINENQSVIQSLSSLISDFEIAYENQNDDFFNLEDAFNISYKLINTIITNCNIKIEQNIYKNIIINGKKNIIIQVILSILQNSLDAFRINKINEPFIKINISTKDDDVIMSFEDNAGGINDDLLLDIFELNKENEIKSNNLTLNMLKIVIRDKFNGRISANNTQNGLEVKIIIRSNSDLLGVNNG